MIILKLEISTKIGFQIICNLILYLKKDWYRGKDWKVRFYFCTI